MIGSVRVLESRFVQSCTSIANAPQISNAEIAILGRSNVGKSSLINALLNNKNLAKSSSTPGKTRLVNVFVSKWQLNSYQKNSSLGAPLALVENFGEQQTPSLVLSPKFSTNTKLPPQILELDSNSNATESSLRGRIIADSHEAIQTYRHTERSEVSKSRKSKTNGESMTQKRINESHRFAQNQRIIGDSQVAKMDSSLIAFAQNDEYVDCFGDESLRNDESSVDCHDSANLESRNDESFVDCHDSTRCVESRNDKNIKNQNTNSKIFDEIVPQRESANEAHLAVRRSEADLSCGAISQKAEFVIHILDFPGFGYAKVSKSERNSWDKNLSTFLKKRESIKLFIHLIDSRHTNLALDNEIRAFLRSIVRADADILEVFTKADKLKKSEIHALKGRILVSTTKKDLGQGDLKDSIESLRHAILRTMYHI